MHNKARIRRYLHVLLLLSAFNLSAHAFLNYRGSFSQDEQPDTNDIADTLEVPIRIVIIPEMGSIQDYRLSRITYIDHLLLEYTSTIDNLGIFPGIYIRDKGSVGQPHEITSFGTGWRTVGALIDNRPANDPMTGVFDFNWFSTEYINTIEYLPPWRSFLYQRNAVSSSYNITTQSYIAPSPYTKIRYSEGPNNYSQTDVVLSQDIAAGLNFMAGIQRQFFGHTNPNQDFRARFPNMNYRNYSYRAKLRWNLPELINIAAAYSFMNSTNGLSGGIDVFATPPEDIFNDREAIVKTLLAYQLNKRQDLTILTSAQLLPDSLDTSNLTLYYSNNHRQYREQERLTAFDTLLYRNDYRTLLLGIDLKQWFTVGPARFHVGGNFQNNHITESTITGKQVEREVGTFIRSIFEPVSQITANIMVRSDWLRNSTYTSFGADLTLSPFESISITGGGVHTYRHPTLQEMFWDDESISRTTSLVPEAHDFIFTEITFKPWNRFSLKLGGMYRYITDPIIYEQDEKARIFPGAIISQGDESEVLTGYAESKLSVGKFTLKGLINMYRIREDGNRWRYLPDIDIQSSLIYRSILFDGALDLQIKLEKIYLSEQFGVDFNPETFISTRQTFARIGPSGVLNGSIVGKIGNAYIHITYQNITGTNYMKTPFYPMYESYLRFGITWEFLN